MSSRGNSGTDTEPIDQDQSKKGPPPTYPGLLKLQAIIHPEGDDAKVTIHTTTGQIQLLVPFEYIGQAESEIRYAAETMVYRQTMKKDAGQAAFTELLNTAMRPAAVTTIIDKKTGDRFFVMQFADHAPIVIQMTPEEVNSALAQMTAAAKTTAN